MENIFSMLSGMGNQHEWHGQDTSQLLPRLRPRLVVNAVFPRDLPRCHQRFSQVRRLQGSRRARHAGNSAAAPSDAATDFRKCQRFIADFCLASEASGRPTMLSTKPPLSLSAGTDWTLCCRPLRMERGTLFQRADRTIRSWDRLSSNWSRGPGRTARRPRLLPSASSA